MLTQTGKGDLGVWRERLGTGSCLFHLCHTGQVERGNYLVLECAGTPEGVGWD